MMTSSLCADSTMRKKFKNSPRKPYFDPKVCIDGVISYHFLCGKQESNVRLNLN